MVLKTNSKRELNNETGTFLKVMVWLFRKNFPKKSYLKQKTSTCFYGLETELWCYYPVLTPCFLWLGHFKSK